MSGKRVYLGRLSHSARERDVEKFFKGFGKLREITLKEGYGFVEFDENRDAEDAVYEMNGKELCGDRVIVEHAKPPGSRGGRGDRMGGGGGRFGGGGRGGGGYGGGGYGGGGYGGGGGGRYGGFSRGPPSRGRNPPPARTDYRLIVENLSSKVSWQDLKDYMRKAGEVTYADAHKIRQNEGVVEFATSSAMREAMEKLDGTELQGRKIKLLPDKGSSGSRKRQSRSRSRSDSRDSRSYSRSRSARSHSRSKSKDRNKGSSGNDRDRSRSYSPERSSGANQNDGYDNAE